MTPSPPSPLGDDPPPVEPTPPDDSACCGSGCDPCVYDLYGEERERYFEQMRAWRARRRRLAEEVRAALMEAARQAFEDAGVQGLCAEGRVEAALGAIERCDLSSLIERPGGSRS
jgi:hypothetical protein